MTESERRLRHLAFFDVIASSDDSDVECRAATAGLLTLRLVDLWVETGTILPRVDAEAIAHVRESIDDLKSRHKLRTVLSGIVDVVAGQPMITMDAISPRLMAYGQLLEYDARWSLASDVYQTVITHTHPVHEADVATQAHLRQGFCLRHMGNLSASLRAYAAAGEIAAAANDMDGVLRARIGEAKADIARGNMPRAQSILDETIERASGPDLRQVKSMALHDRSDLAYHDGDFELAIKLAYEALASTDSQRERDRILGDIAASFFQLGVRSAAKDAYMILAATGQEQYQRWTATLNLMEIAALDGEELMFEQYRRSINVRALPPHQETMYWWQAGSGYEALGKIEEARSFLKRAVEVAEDHELNRLAFKAEKALEELGKRKKPAKREVAEWNDEVRAVAGELSDERVRIGL